MNPPHAFVPVFSIAWLAAIVLRQQARRGAAALIARLSAALKRRIAGRAEATARAAATPHAPLGLWAGSLAAAAAHRHGRCD